MRLREDRLAGEKIGKAIEIQRRSGRSGAPPTTDAAASTKPRWADSLREWLQRFTKRGVTQSVLLLSNHSRNLKPSSVSHLEAATAETTGFL